jgi:hypothetical protein
MNEMLMRIFGTKGDKVTGRWRKVHNDELRSMYAYNFGKFIGILISRSISWVV